MGESATALARTYGAEVDRDRLFGLAAETAFFAVLSIFPGLLVAVSLLGLLQELVGADVAAAAQQRVVGLLSLVLTEQASDAVAAVESLFEERRTGLLSVATVGALETLSTAFAVTINALNLAHDVTESRPWIRRRLLGLVMAARQPHFCRRRPRRGGRRPVLRPRRALGTCWGWATRSSSCGTSCACPCLLSPWFCG